MKSFTHILFVCISFSIWNGNNAAAPKTRLCREQFHVAWMTIAPYFEETRETHNHSHSGIITDILETAMSKCCRGKMSWNYSEQFQTVENITSLHHLEHIDFILPLQMETLSDTINGHFPFVPLVQSPGLAFYSLPHQGSSTIVQALTALKPLLILMLLFTCIGAVSFYLIENFTKVYHGDEVAQPFVIGVVSSFWWSFISMTTVGYGDVLPKSKPAKIFSVIWVLFGAGFCACFTSVMTTMLQMSLFDVKVELKGTQVAVLKGSQEHKYAMMKQADLIQYDSIDDILEAVAKGKVHGALLDVYIATEHMEELDILHLQDVIEHTYYHGVSFQNNGFLYVDCIRDYVMSHQNDIIEFISHRVNFSALHGDIMEARTSIDYRKPSYYIPTLSLLFALVFVLLIGRTVEIIYQRGTSFEKLIEEGDLEELTLSQWRHEYKMDIVASIRAISDDMKKIQDKVESFQMKWDVKQKKEHAPEVKACPLNI